MEKTLKDSGFRVDIDERSERMTSKIRDAQMAKIPFMLVIGDKEVSSQGASVRLRTGEDLGPQSIDEIQSRIQAAVESKA